MKSTFNAILVIGVCLLGSTIASAQTEVRDAVPTAGQWTGQSPGTWIVTKQVTRDAKSGERIEYQRELFVGVDEKQVPWSSVYKSDSPDGPWKYLFGSGGASSYFDDPPATVTVTKAQPLVVGSHTLTCTVRRYERTDDASIVTGERWIDDATHLDVQHTRTTRPRDADAKRYESVYTTRTTAIEKRRLNDRDITALVQESTDALNGVVRTTTHAVVSSDVPSRRISFRSWNGGDASGPPARETTTIAWGRDLETLASERKRINAGRERHDKLAHFHEDTVADAERGDATVRARALSNIGANTFRPELRDRIVQVVRAGLADPDVGVRRGAAEAAGFQRVEGTAARIAELYRNDPDGAPQYLRALGRLADPAGLDAVLDAIGKKNPMASDMALEAIVNFADDRATAKIKDLLSSNTYRYTRSSVATHLGRSKSPRAAELLLAVVDDADMIVRRATLNSIGEIGDARGLDPAIKALADPDKEVRVSAAMAVFRIAEKHEPTRAAASDALWGLFEKKEEDARARGAAMIALARLKDSRLLPILKEMAAAPFDEAAVAGDWFLTPSAPLAMRSLMLMDTPESLAALMELAQHPTSGKLAMSALREAKSPHAARAAWNQYRQKPFEAGQGEWVRRSELLSIIRAYAGKPLRDEIESTIASAPPEQRPELRLVLRLIDERLTPTSQPSR